MHFAVVSVEMCCLVVPYIYRFCVDHGDVKKRWARTRGQAKETVIVRMRGQRMDRTERYTVMLGAYTVNNRLRAYAKASL